MLIGATSNTSLSIQKSYNVYIDSDSLGNLLNILDCLINGYLKMLKASFICFVSGVFSPLILPFMQIIYTKKLNIIIFKHKIKIITIDKLFLIFK